MVQFSVVVPTYNRASTLPRAIESVLVQTNDDFELIVVDDGSTDETSVVLAQFDDARIEYLRQSNRGVAAARNAGAARASGRWMVFLDSDDELLPRTIAHFSQWSGEHKLLVGGVTRISADGTRQQTVLLDRELVLTKRFTPLLAGSFAIRREVFDEVGGYDETLAYSENTELAWRLRTLLRENNAIEVIDEPLALIRNQRERGHDQARYDAAKLILTRRSYEMESDDERARREFRGNYLCIAAVSAADLGRRREALSLVVRAIVAEPASMARYRSAVGVARRIFRPAP